MAGWTWLQQHKEKTEGQDAEMTVLCCSLRIMARLGIEPRLPEHRPGTLPTELQLSSNCAVFDLDITNT